MINKNKDNNGKQKVNLFNIIKEKNQANLKLICSNHEKHIERILFRIKFKYVKMYKEK